MRETTTALLRTTVPTGGYATYSAAGAVIDIYPYIYIISGSVL